mgnify:CR=1 FL=1
MHIHKLNGGGGREKFQRRELAQYRKTPRLSILDLGNFLGGRTEMLTFELSEVSICGLAV